MLFSRSFIINFLHLASQTEAFMPFDWREAHLGASGVSHKAMTRNAYERLAAEFWPDIKKLTGTMVRARNTWALANGRVDEEVTHTNAHCDAEDFVGCNSFILDRRQDTINALQANQKKVVAAQESLGRALHPLQDFYAHSNWIEMNNGAVVHPKLGVKLRFANETPIPNPDPTVSTCTTCKPHINTGSELWCQAECLKGDGLIGLYDELAKMNLSLPMGLTSFIVGGIQLLPSVVQREYCREDCLCHDCNQAGFTNVLTSGYSSEEFKTHPIPQKDGVFKCVHGGHSDGLGRTLEGKHGGNAYIDPFFQEAYDGINKDSMDCSWSPHGPKWHKSAVDAATNHTVKFLREIAQELDPLELKLLFGVGPSLAFAIDTTSSMRSVIRDVSTEVMKIVDHRRGQLDEPSLYILSEINESAKSPGTVKSETDPWKFKADILALNASGGEDCGAFSMAGTMNALNQLSPGADLFIITDSSVKDPESEFDVVKLATRKGIRLWPFVFAGCGESTHIFERIAKVTHGQAFHNLTRTDATLITKIADTIVRSNAVSILSSDINFFSALTYLEENYLDGWGLLDALIALNNFKSLAQLTGQIFKFFGVMDWLGMAPFKTSVGNPTTNPTATKVTITPSPTPSASAWKGWWKRDDAQSQRSDDTWSYFIPIDTAMSQFSVQIVGTVDITAIHRPDGTTVQRDHPFVSHVPFSSGQIITIQAPKPGFWALSLKVRGDYNLKVMGISDLQYAQFSFVKVKGRPGHEGFDTIDEAPTPGVEHPIITTMEGNFKDCMFACCSTNGTNNHNNITLLPGSGEYGQPGKNSHFGIMRVPVERVHNYAYGFDLNGAPYQRVFNGASV